MTTHRIDGIKYNFDRLTEGELEGIHGYLLDSHARCTAEIEVVEHELFSRRHQPLDFEENLSAYAEIADIVIERPEAAQLDRTASLGRTVLRDVS